MVWIHRDPLCRAVGALERPLMALALQGPGLRISSGWTSSRAYLSLFVRPRLAWWTSLCGRFERLTVG